MIERGVGAVAKEKAVVFGAGVEETPDDQPCSVDAEYKGAVGPQGIVEGGVTTVRQ